MWCLQLPITLNPRVRCLLAAGQDVMAMRDKDSDADDEYVREYVNPREFIIANVAGCSLAPLHCVVFESCNINAINRHNNVQHITHNASNAWPSGTFTIKCFCSRDSESPTIQRKALRWVLVPEHDHARELDVSAGRCEIVDAKALKMVRYLLTLTLTLSRTCSPTMC